MLEGLVRSSGALFVARASAMALNVVAYVVAARSLAASQFAVGVATVAVASLVALISDFGSSTLVLRGSGDSDDAVLVRSVALLVVAAGGITSMVLALVDVIPVSPGLIGYGAVYAVGYAQLASALAWLQANGRTPRASSMIVVDKVFAVGVTVVFVESLGATSLIAGQAAGVVVALAATLLLTPGARRVPHLTGDVRRAVACAVPLFAGSAVVQLLGLDVLIIDLVAGSDAAAAAALPSRLAVPLGLLASSVATMSVVHFSRLDAPRGRRDLDRITALTVAATAVVAAPVIVLADAFTGRVLPAAFSDDGGAAAMIVAALGVVAVSATQPAGSALIARGRERLLLGLVSLSVALGLVGSVVGAAAFGAPGGVAGRLVAGLVAIGLVLPAARRAVSVPTEPPVSAREELTDDRQH